MRNIWRIFCADWKRLTASVVAVVVMLGLCLVPCLYAWFNILSNWDPYGPASTGRIKVAVASEDDGYEVLGLHLNIGELVLQGLETNDQMGWVFVDDAQTALDGVNAGDYYAALILPPEFTGDFVSILEGDLRHPEIQYYENEKKNAIAPKITGKAKTAVQEEINTTILEKVADALTTAGSVFKAMGLDGQDVADDLLEKLSSAQQDMDQMAEVFRSLQNVMDGAGSLLAASAITISDAQSTMNSTSAAVGSTVQLIDTGLDAADDTSDDLLQVLNTADAALSELEDMLNGVDLTPAEDITHEKIIAQIDKVIAALQRVCNRTDDAVLVDRLEAAIDRLETLKSAVEQSGLSHVQDELRQVIEEVRELLRTAAVKTNQQVNAYIQKAGERAQSTLGSVQEILTASSGALGGVSGTLRSYSSAISAAQPTLAASVTLAESVSGYLADMEEDVRRITDSAAFKRFVELMASDSDSMAVYLASPVQMNTQIIYEIKDYGAAMSPYYVMLALFVGSLLTAVMVKVPVTQPKFQPCRAIERYFGRFLTFFFMAIAQALVTAFGCLHFVGMEAAEPALFVLACCICSLNFAFMNYALVRHHHGITGGRLRRLLPYRRAACAVPKPVSLHALPLRHGHDPGDHRRYVRPDISALRTDPAGDVRAVHRLRPAGLLSGPQAERGYRRQ